MRSKRRAKLGAFGLLVGGGLVFDMGCGYLSLSLDEEAAVRHSGGTNDSGASANTGGAGGTDNPSPSGGASSGGRFGSGGEGAGFVGGAAGSLGGDGFPQGGATGEVTECIGNCRCAPGEECTLECSSTTDSCRPRCDSGSRCHIESGQAPRVVVDCDGECFIHGAARQSLIVECHGKGRCQVDCDYATSCDLVCDAITACAITGCAADASCLQCLSDTVSSNHSCRP